MAEIYLSAAEFIKKREFELWVPAFYHTHMTDEMINPERGALPKANPYRLVPTRRRNPAPFRPLIDPNQMQRANYSTEVMIDLFQKKIEFEIVNDIDIPEMFDGLDWYLESLKINIQMGAEVFIEYARKVIKWREELYKHYYRFMQQNPTAKEGLYPNNSPKINLFHLMSVTRGLQDQKRELDPLRARAYPPYNIDQIIPRDVVKEEDKFAEGGSYGISNAGEATVDDRDFDFEAFMGKS